ncbi:hypothetical protein [Levilactobacillus phage ENFP1]|nr:hypothetical protein [Levilactobacillus phage ENFP1]
MSLEESYNSFDKRFKDNKSDYTNKFTEELIAYCFDNSVSMDDIFSGKLSPLMAIFLTYPYLDQSDYKVSHCPNGEIEIIYGSYIIEIDKDNNEYTICERFNNES